MLLAGVSLPLSSNRDSSHCTEGSSMHSPLPTADTRAAMISRRSNCSMMLSTVRLKKFEVCKLKKDKWILGCVGASDIQVHVPRFRKCSSMLGTCRHVVNQNDHTLQIDFLKSNFPESLNHGRETRWSVFVEKQISQSEIRWSAFVATQIPQS